MQKILVANRGEIAVRVIRTCRKMGISSVAVFSEADRDALHVQAADEAFLLGAPTPDASYLDAQRILAVARESGAQAIHPGYGFLSENAAFAAAVIEAGLVWIGPPVAAMEAMASKIRAREIACAQQVPVIPGLTLARDPDAATLLAIENLGYPLLVKASAGGGGIGMRELHSGDELDVVLRECRRQAQRQFADSTLLVERLVRNARHVEVQVVGDKAGTLLHLLDRDCSMQRRRQKLLEEAPAPDLPVALRTAMHEAALRLAAAVGYHSVGTVEFLVQGEEFFLLEMNTRLQVEHGATEAVTGLDLVQLQIEIASDQDLTLSQQDIKCDGHAIEARLYAENPARDFAPSTGPVVAFHSPAERDVRLDSGIEAGSVISHYYDGLLCKLIAHGTDREQATSLLERALTELCMAGPTSNQQFLRALLRQPDWQLCAMHTLSVEQNIVADTSLSWPLPEDVEAAMMVATIWRFQLEPPAADKVPWPGGFTQLRSARWRVGEHNLDLDWRWRASREFYFPVQDVSVRLVSAECLQGTSGTRDRLLLVEMAGQRRCFECYAGDEQVWIWEAGIGTLLLAPSDPAAGSGAPGSDGHCVSAGPGLVLRVMAEPGQRVARGEALLVLESMKMESTLRAPGDGIVDSVNVEAGVLVETGQRLITINLAQEDVA